MTESVLAGAIEAAWEGRDNPAILEDASGAVEDAIELLDSGRLRVAQPIGDNWIVCQWLKKAVLLSFRLRRDSLTENGYGNWYDRVGAKFAGWDGQMFDEARVRAVPPCAVRRGAYIAPSVVIMPSFVNIGAYVGASSMIDTWASVGSCAQIGSNVHLSGGVGIGGVLEPMQARPTIIEDDCFIGARSEIAEGVIVRRGSVLAMGVFISASTKIVHRDTRAVTLGEVPPYSVVVPGSLPAADGGPSLACAVIVKTVDARTRAKTALNDLLRT